MPENWDKDYLLYCLYGWGVVAVFNTDKFGVIPQACGLGGYNIYYKPTTALINNSLIPDKHELKIGEQCEIIKLMPNYSGIMDLVSSAAEDMALLMESASVNAINSKMAYVFVAGDKKQAESFKKMYDQVASGEPAVFIDSNLLDKDGKLPCNLLSQNVGQNYIVEKFYADVKKREAMFDNDIGIPNANTDKKERLIVDEVNANNVETYTKAELWLGELQESLERVRTMFDIPEEQLNVKWREPSNPIVNTENGTSLEVEQDEKS